MPRTYVRKDDHAVMILRCSTCSAVLRQRVPVDPANWPLHRCSDLKVRPFDSGERSEVAS